MSKAKTGGVNYEYYINNYSSWYGGDRNEYEDCKKEIQLSLNSKNPDWAEVSTNMEYIAEYYACKGNLLAFTNKLSGWLLLIQGFYYADWATKISYRYYDFLDSTYDEEEDEFLFILVPLDFPGIGIDRKSQNY